MSKLILFIYGLFYEYHVIVKQHTLENIIFYEYFTPLIVFYWT